ncbi:MULTISPECIES: hypothetical protein [Thermus]|jgi:hypothetical protein|uniref:Uncharacterized protein n=3 Tax=Thermus TaxID=270 RepID=A0A1J0LSY1_THEBO|nr:hypothetical protein [Thermus brockianus]APD09194.1 hypothetical protein A0O31_01041 [Thermus brockianus]
MAKMPKPRLRPRKRPGKASLGIEVWERWQRLSPEERKRVAEGVFFLLSLLPLGRAGAWLKVLAGPGGQVAYTLFRLLKR